MSIFTREIRLATAESTMDSARAALAGEDFLLVTADTQSRGKGTRGRHWQSPRGNLYMTVAMHRRHLTPGRLALLPLEIGLLLWDEAACRIPDAAKKTLTLKWPNDLLLGGSKAAGVLMESHGDHVLCGVGVNIAVAPEVADGGATSACLADAGMSPEEAPAFADGFFRRCLAAFPGSGDGDPGSVLLAWQGRSDWERSHRLRDRPGKPWVRPISLNRHGHLLVRHADGSSEWLVSEYLG